MRLSNHTNIIGSCPLPTPAAYFIWELVFFWVYIRMALPDLLTGYELHVGTVPTEISQWKTRFLSTGRACLHLSCELLNVFCRYFRRSSVLRSAMHHC
jgi:hypothetical protein